MAGKSVKAQEFNYKKKKNVALPHNDPMNTVAAL